MSTNFNDLFFLLFFFSLHICNIRNSTDYRLRIFFYSVKIYIENCEKTNKVSCRDIRIQSFHSV